MLRPTILLSGRRCISTAGWSKLESGAAVAPGGPSIPDFDVSYSGKTAEPKMAFNFAHLLSATCGGAPRRLGRLRRPWARCARLFWGGYQHQKSAGEGTHSVLVAP